MGYDIKKIAVFGGGIMGPGIAQMMAYAGRDVILYDIADDQLEKSKATLHRGLETFVERGKISADDVEKLFSKVSYTTDMAKALEGTDLVMEAVTENPKIKTLVYDQYNKLAGENCILASNTSALNIFPLMPKERLNRTLIAHWYAPANVIPLVEVCTCDETEEDAVAAVMDVLKDAQKIAIRMKKFIQGYIVNRLQQCILTEVQYLLDNGYCTPEDIDLASKVSWIPRAMVLGLVQKNDFAGVEISANNIRNKSYQPTPFNGVVPHVMQTLIDRGEVGIQVGKGYYDYSGIERTDLLAQRDEMLFEAFSLEEKFMSNPLGRKRDDWEEIVNSK